MPQPRPRRVFSLDEARQLLPVVKAVTAEAVREAEAVADRLRRLNEDDPDHDRLAAELDALLNAWAAKITELDLEAKGLWLVDFDNGEGYYCWCYPEETISHYHSYDGGFAGRIPIM